LIKAVEHDKVLQLLLIGDIGFLLRDESIVNRVASPTKFAEYCLAGLPVITTDFVGDFSAIIKEHDLGWIVDLHNIDRLDQGLISFIRNVQANRKLWALRCSRFAQEHLSWQSYGYTLASIYADLNKELERYYTLTDFGSDE
jgi:glycosyltransferase involved in cell wall biosynthesis